MNDRQRELFEAHVRFELDRLQGTALEKSIREEIAAFWEWADQTTLQSLTTVERIQDIARRLVVELELPDELADTIGVIAKHLVNLDINRETRIADVLDEDVFDQGVELVVGLRDLREAAVRRTTNSPLYAMLASDLLYHGIRDYLFSDSALLKRLPGVSSLLSKGAGAVSKRMPGIEEQIETRVRGFIESNLSRTIAQSEEFLLRTLTDERVRKLGADIWDDIQHSHLSLADVLDDAEVDDIVVFGMTVWRQLRETEYVTALIDEGIAEFFAEHGEDTIAALLERVGVDRAIIEREALELVPPLLDVAAESGYLEATVRRRLEAFYDSDTTAALL